MFPRWRPPATKIHSPLTTSAGTQVISTSRQLLTVMEACTVGLTTVLIISLRDTFCLNFLLPSSPPLNRWARWDLFALSSTLNSAPSLSRKNLQVKRNDSYLSKEVTVNRRTFLTSSLFSFFHDHGLLCQRSRGPISCWHHYFQTVCLPEKAQLMMGTIV